MTRRDWIVNLLVMGGWLVLCAGLALIAPPLGIAILGAGLVGLGFVYGMSDRQ